ncbi:MAG TPA: histidinol-phosphate transaminase [Gemmatimonadaceae bacterium]|nr:histidinol-phosphate transaminase [Gemmatimonadaceae bacterium]
MSRDTELVSACPQHTVAPRTASPARTAARIRIRVAREDERAAIWRMRHDVYARELGQHATNGDAALSDALDASNVYIVAMLGRQMAGFISITPPASARYSIDKYLSRAELPFACDAGLYEVRLLTVPRQQRGGSVASLLMYAAMRWIEDAGGTRVVAIGRVEVLDLYRKAGLEMLGRRIVSGAVTFELMTATVARLSSTAARSPRVLRRLARGTDWQLGVAFESPAPCYHGGAFFSAVGEDFRALERAASIINADVLDAWFPPCPGAMEALREHLHWLARTSPPTTCDGLVRAIAGARGVAAASIVPASGSSDLIFRAFGAWLTPASRVLLLDPTYGEYAHVTQRVIGCTVDRLALSRERGYRLDPSDLVRATAREYDLIVLVNPNSPTGTFLPRAQLAAALERIPPRTMVWVDETYIEYAGAAESLESYAASSERVVVCKSMSKVYALSGLRVAYLCAPPPLARQIRALTPPWVVGLPGQVAAVHALADPEYYAGRYAETHRLRGELAVGLRSLGGMSVHQGVANFVLCHLDPAGPRAAEICRRCEEHGLFVRDAEGMGPSLGTHTLRVAVKDAVTNARMLDILQAVLGECRRPGIEAGAVRA